MDEIGALIMALDWVDWIEDVASQVLVAWSQPGGLVEVIRARLAMYG